MFPITIGLFGLTALYVGMVIAIHYLSPIDCLKTLDSNGDTTTTYTADESQLEMEQMVLCQSEGVDNTILNWSSDFFIAIWMFLFAFQLSICPIKTTPGKGEPRSITTNEVVLDSGILAQIFMGGAFVLSGIGSLLFPNSGNDDNHGMVGYWIAYVMSALFFTASGLCMAHFALETTKNTNPVHLQGFCHCFDLSSRTTKLVIVGSCELMLVLSLSGFLTGSIWCSTDLTLQVNDVTDEWMRIDTNAANTHVDLHVCFTISYYSDMAMNFAYALLWLPIGFLLRAASQQKTTVVLGLPTPIAAVLATLLQWTVGSLLLVVLFIVNLSRNDDDEEPFMIWNTMYGTVLYHWGMLLTFYCLHNISCGLTVRCDSKVYEVDIDSDNNNNNDNDNDNNCDTNDNVNNNDDNEVQPSSSSWWLSLFKKNHHKKKKNKKRTKKEQQQQEKERQRREAVAQANAMFIDTENAMSFVSSTSSEGSSSPTLQKLKAVSFEDDNNTIVVDDNHQDHRNEADVHRSMKAITHLLK